MRQKSKRFILMLCVALCSCFLAACSSQDTDASRYSIDPGLAGSISDVSEGLLAEISSIEKDDAEYIEDELRREKQTALADGVADWISVQSDTGPYVNALSSQVTMEDADTYICTVYAQFANRNVEFKIYYTLENQGLSPTSISFTPEYTLGEKMQKAFMNMILGMGIVFLILIFLSLLISCFKFINIAQEKYASGKKDAQSADEKEIPAGPADEINAQLDFEAEPEITELTETEPMDDLELVAVIAAAIAASEDIPADGLRVRSIRRVSGSNWKKS